MIKIKDFFVSFSSEGFNPFVPITTRPESVGITPQTPGDGSNVALAEFTLS